MSSMEEIGLTMGESLLGGEEEKSEVEAREVLANSEGRKGVRYLGQYKPMSAYTLSNDLVIVPANAEHASFGGGSYLTNVSYVASTSDRTDSDLIASFRQWLAFDSFVLDDHVPIFHFDNRTAGNITVLRETLR